MSATKVVNPEEKHSVEISIAFSTFGSSVKIDGVEIPMIKKIELVHEAGSPPLLTLEVWPQHGGEVTGETQVVVNPVPLPEDVRG